MYRTICSKKDMFELDFAADSLNAMEMTWFVAALCQFSVTLFGHLRRFFHGAFASPNST